jgi:competence protein ComEC
MCGKDNSYSHPNLQVVSRFEETGAEILRTDINGDIVIISDGKNLSVKKGRGD